MAPHENDNDGFALSDGLCMAFKKNRVDVAALLLRSGADAKKSFDTAHFLYDQGYFEIVKLWTLGCYPNISEAIIESCSDYSYYPEVVKLLIAENPAFIDNTLLLACRREAFKAVRLLVESGGKLNGINISLLLESLPGSECVWASTPRGKQPGFIERLLMHYLSILNNTGAVDYLTSFFVTDIKPIAARGFLKFIQEPTIDNLHALNEYKALFRNQEEPLGKLWTMYELFLPQELKVKYDEINKADLEFPH